ncbi:uncharacterized protein LOC120844568 [Ixodes scapularis]|uniref:uncharacterized protein LOC120844568 n=1 Tax=Ixodes scapularis TaxID=6945 RepID=UPI001A9E9B45|nr:uncharacterized protein LOC120844568 [Ixodes scapularis]
MWFWCKLSNNPCTQLEPAAGGRAVLVQAVQQPVHSTDGAFFEPAARGRAVLVQAVQQPVPSTGAAFFEPAAGGHAVLVQAVQQPVPSTSGAFFTTYLPCQGVATGGRNRGSKWSNATVKSSLQIRFACGSTGYDLLLDKGFPLPSARTLRRRLEGIRFEPGVLEEVFKLLETKVAHLKPQERKCVLLLDEMALVEKFEYDPSTSCIRDYTAVPVPQEPRPEPPSATYALVFMIAGISSRWKQVICYHYTGNSFCGKEAATQVKILIKRCNNVGLQVVAVTSDMSSGNRVMLQHFDIYSGRYSRTTNKIPHPQKPGEQIVFLADVPHLIKNLNGHLVRGQTIVLPTDVVTANNLTCPTVSLDPIRQLVEFQKDLTFKLAPKLRPELLDPNHFEKMKVSAALQVLSHSTATALRFLVENHGWSQDFLTTAWFFEQRYEMRLSSNGHRSRLLDTVTVRLRPRSTTTMNTKLVSFLENNNRLQEYVGIKQKQNFPEEKTLRAHCNTSSEYSARVNSVKLLLDTDGYAARLPEPPHSPPDMKVRMVLKNIIKTSIYIFPSGQVVGGAQGTQIHTGEGFASSMENKGPPATTNVA